MALNTATIASMSRLAGTEILINMETADQFIADMARFSTVQAGDIAQLEADSRSNLAMVYGFDDDYSPEDRKPFVYSDGTAVIPIHGTLLNRFSGSWGFVTGYAFIRRQLNAALEDDDVVRIIFDVNSPGGEAAGCFELAREIMASRRVKPSLAMVDSTAASGGMALAGSATKMFAIPSARIGSIGVYRQHISYEGALKNEGIKITFASAGEHKVDGHPYADLPAGVLKDWTEDVNRTWTDFIDLVAETRDMTPEDVKATQAKIYRADEALAKGLINAVKTVSEALPAFVAELADEDPSSTDEDEDMASDTSKSEVASVDYGKIGTMIADAVGGAMAGLQRSAAIKDHGKAKGLVAMAAKLAANDKISEAEAIELIDAAAAAAAPKKPAGKKPKGKGARAGSTDDDGEGEGEDDDPANDDDEDGDGEGDDEDGEGGEEASTPKTPKGKGKGNSSVDQTNHFANAMSNTKQPRVGGGAGGDSQKDKTSSEVDALLGDHSALCGVDYTVKKTVARK